MLTGKKRTREVNHKDICSYYFATTGITHKCKLCSPEVIRTADVKKNGYSNLMSHVSQAHPEYVNVNFETFKPSITKFMVTYSPKVFIHFSGFSI